MEKYNYQEAVKNDVKAYFEDNYNDFNGMSRDELEEALEEACWTADSVTGNGSGSYTFNTWEAEENLCHNMDLLEEALEEFGCGIEYLEKGAEACDVTIRCYLLSQAIAEVVNEYMDNENE